MKRFAILGGGIAGLAAAYELELARKRGADIDWQLYEASPRLGGLIETVQRGGFTIECGPEAWVSGKPWMQELAVELGLREEIIACKPATRKTWVRIGDGLLPMPDRMRMMVPEDLATLEGSALFSAAACAAYAAELANADELRREAPAADESVASFVLRHFGEEVLTKIGAPLLSGVFGGDVAKLSVRAVMPAFVAMEQEHGSLIAALQAKAKARGGKPDAALFTTLRSGLGSFVDALVATLPAERLHCGRSVLSLKRQGKKWLVRTEAFATEGRTSKKHVDHVFVCTPVDVTRALLEPLDAAAAALLPTEASSAVLAALCWSGDTAATFEIPVGYGFLVPKTKDSAEPTLMAATFVDQKFPQRVPEGGGRILRGFFGGTSAEAMAKLSDEAVAAEVFAQLQAILGPMPAPDAALTVVRRWPRSLPQYGVGHLDRLATLDCRVAMLGGLSLLGNGFRGVGLPDLIRDSRAAVRAVNAGA